MTSRHCSQILATILIASTRILGAPAVASRAVQTIRLPLIDGNDIRFTHLSTEEGLSQSRVDHILQDAQGFIWIGTGNGLNRFDGYRPKVYKQDVRNPNSLGGVFVTALFQDRSGALWIGVDQGLDRFDPVTETFKHFIHKSNDPASLSGHVEHINQDRDGNLWVATRNGLDRFDPSTQQFKHYRHDRSNPYSLSSDDIRYVYQDREGTLWVATAAGLNAFNTHTEKAIQYANFQEAPLDRIFEDRSGVLWVSSTRGGGVASLDRQTGQFTRYTFFDEGPGAPATRGCSAILEDQYGMIWLATMPDGLVKFDRQQRKFARYKNNPDNPAGLSGSSAYALLEDHEGGIWVGTYGGGVNRFSSRPSPFTTYRSEAGNPHSLHVGGIIAIFEDSEGILWIGTDQLNRLDRATGTYTFYRHDAGNAGSISNNLVHGVVEDRSHTLWFGTWGGGLNRFDRRTGRFTAFRHNSSDPASLSNDFILSMCLDHSGALWIGTEDGVDRMDPATGRFTVYRSPDAAPESRIYPVLTEGNGESLWMGTFEWGLERLDVRTGKIVTFQHDPSNPNSLSANRVNALYSDQLGILWVGTQNGLNRYDSSSGGFTTFSEQDGLPDNAVMGILGDDTGNLWLSTGNGLSKFDPSRRTFQNYYSEDGLVGDEFNNYAAYFKSSHGEMFFGGVKGLTAFFPDRVADNPFVPPVVLTDFRLFGQTVDVGGRSPLQQSISFTNSLTLSHRQNNFSLEFASLSYANPLRNRYRYKLEGLDERWMNVGSNHRSVTFPFLPPGTYTFRAQGSSNRSVWNQVGASLRIEVLPPWWATLWFRAAAILFLLASIWSVYKFRVRAVEARNRQLARHNLEMQQSQIALRQSEGEQRRLNRELRAISNCNQALIRAVGERELLNEICRIICDDAGYRMAWVGYVEHDEAKTIRPVAWGGVEEGYLAGQKLTWEDTELGSGPAGIAVRRGATSYTQDLSISPAFAPWRAEALKRGYRSVIAFPLKAEKGQVFGILAIYSTEASSFTMEEIRLLEELAGDLSFGITVLRARIEHDRMEQQLRQAQKMEIIGKLSGGIAHDFNNILGVINGYSEILLRRRALDAASHHEVQEILHAGQHAALLTRQLLAFSRKQILQPETIDLNRVIEHVKNLLGRLLGEEIETISLLQPDLSSIEIDPGEMEQIILNLCINARDAMPAGGTLTIETKNVEVETTQETQEFPVKAGDYVCLKVSDTGTGMDDETLSQIFEPFFTTKGPEKGTGLGLATVFRIIKQNGGGISVRSEPNRGSSFCVYLPRAAQIAKIDEPESGKLELARGKETILLVEDADSLRAMLRTCLEASGYAVLTAEDGEQALQISQTEGEQFDLLLTDLSLPKIKGPALAKLIQQQRPETRVLFMSGYASTVMEAALNSTASFLQKPFSEEELIGRVREALDAQPSGAISA